MKYSKDPSELYSLIKCNEYIQSAEFARDFDGGKDKLTLILSPCPYVDGDDRLEIVFYNVSELKVYNNLLFGCICPILISIQDISNRHWEGLKYYIDEAEGTFSFYCGDYEYQII